MSKIDNKIITMYEDGHSTHEIAKKLKTYPNKIRRTLIKNGIETRNASEAQKASLEKGTSTHPTKGKIRTEAEKLKISSSMEGYWDDMDVNVKQRRVEEARQRWESRSEEEKQKMISSGIHAIRRTAKEGSKLEKEILKGLSSAGYSVDFHNENLIPTEKLEIDMYIPDLKTIIEVDGPSHFLPIWGDDHLSKQEKFDLKKNGTLLSRGFVVIRVKALNAASLSRTKKLLDNIIEHLESIKESFPSKSKRFIEVEL